MKKITIEDSYEYFYETLKLLDISDLDNSDEYIEYIYLEELDIGTVSFLHSETVQKLLKYNLINESTAKESLKLREIILTLISEKREVKQIRFDTSWKQVREKAKNILNEINPDSADLQSLPTS